MPLPSWPHKLPATLVLSLQMPLLALCGGFAAAQTRGQISGQISRQTSAQTSGQASRQTSAQTPGQAATQPTPQAPSLQNGTQPLPSASGHATGSALPLLAFDQSGPSDPNGQPSDTNKPAGAAEALVEAPESEPLTVFPHSDTTRYFIAGQANIVFQAHGPFHSPYSGPNSLLARGEYKTSMLGTLYTAYQLNPNPRFATDAIFDLEIADGRGISEALGLAGATNLDVVRNPNLGKPPYLARYELHQVIGLSSNLATSDRGPFSLPTQLPAQRIELHIGRMSMPDFFDINTVGSDSHLQFLNWTVDNNGAWDYAANTRGYTDAAVAEYYNGAFSARYGLAAMPTVANGQTLQYQFRRASGQNAELELGHGPASLLKALASRAGAIRLLGFVNHANMGDYRQQNIDFLEQRAQGLPVSAPDITAHPLQSTVKYGVGLNLEQDVTGSLRLYGRFGWNEDAHESFCYTEVAQTFSLGGDYSGRQWGRENDKIGLTFVSNAIKRDHQAYLKLGGLGFILGDGNLSYAREDIVEGYYNAHVWRGLYYALDGQFIQHPGYNQDRGPVLVEAVRMHVDF